MLSDKTTENRSYKFQPSLYAYSILISVSFSVLLLGILRARNATRTSGKGAYYCVDEDDERASAPNREHTHSIFM